MLSTNLQTILVFLLLYEQIIVRSTSEAHYLRRAGVASAAAAAAAAASAITGTGTPSHAGVPGRVTPVG